MEVCSHLIRRMHSHSTEVNSVFVVRGLRRILCVERLFVLRNTRQFLGRREILLEICHILSEQEIGSGRKPRHIILCIRTDSNLTDEQFYQRGNGMRDLYLEFPHVSQDSDLIKSQMENHHEVGSSALMEVRTLDRKT